MEHHFWYDSISAQPDTNRWRYNLNCVKIPKNRQLLRPLTMILDPLCLLDFLIIKGKQQSHQRFRNLNKLGLWFEPNFRDDLIKVVFFWIKKSFLVRASYICRCRKRSWAHRLDEIRETTKVRAWISADLSEMNMAPRAITSASKQKFSSFTRFKRIQAQCYIVLRWEICFNLHELLQTWGPQSLKLRKPCFKSFKVCIKRF